MPRPRLNTPGQLDEGLSQYMTKQSPNYERDFFREFDRRDALDQTNLNYDLDAQFRQNLRDRGLLPEVPNQGIPNPTPTQPRGIDPSVAVDLAFDKMMRVSGGLGGSVGEGIADAINSGSVGGALDALNPFNPDSALSPGEVWEQIVQGHPQLTQSERDRLAFLGRGPDAKPWDTWGALLDRIRGNPREERLNRYGLNFDNALQQTLDELRLDESLGIPPSELDKIDEILNDTGTPPDDQDDDQSDVGQDFDFGDIYTKPPYNPPPTPPENPGYFDVTVRFAIYKGSFFVNDDGQSDRGLEFTGGFTERKATRVPNPHVVYDDSKIGEFVTTLDTDNITRYGTAYGVQVFGRNGLHSSFATQEGQGVVVFYLSQASWYMPISVDYEFVEPPDWYDPAETSCLAPQWLPEMEKTLENVQAKIATLDSKLDSISQGILSRIQQMETMLFNQVAAATGAKVEQRHDERRDAILDALSALDIEVDTSSLAKQSTLQQSVHEILSAIQPGTSTESATAVDLTPIQETLQSLVTGQGDITNVVSTGLLYQNETVIPTAKEEIISAITEAKTELDGSIADVPTAVETALCDSECIPSQESLEDIKKALCSEVTIAWNITDCNASPSEDPTEIKVENMPRIEAIAASIELLGETLDQHAQKTCSIEPVAGVPEWWATRIGAERPQLIIFFADKKQDGSWGTGRWSVTIPHYRGNEGTLPAFGKYTRGSNYGRLTLADNSKLIVNAVSEAEAERFINIAKGYINAELLRDSSESYGQRKGQDIGQVEVWPKYGYFYSKGQKQTRPDWKIDWTQ